MSKGNSLYDVGYVYRLVLGNNNPEMQPNEELYEKQSALLNKCLTSSPKGKIIGQEKNFYILNIGEHQVVMQYIVYHIGFERKPYWLSNNSVN